MTDGATRTSPVRFFAVEPEELRPLEVPRGAKSVHELFDGLPLGVYTAFRTFHHERFLGLEDHFDRMDRCMELSGWSRRLDRTLVRRRLHEAVRAWPLEDALVRLDVLRQRSPLLSTQASCLLSLSSLAPLPAKFLEEGVRIEIAPGLKRPNPRIKTADFVIARRPYPLNRQQAYEHLLVDEQGRILEATSANFYVFFGERLGTPGDGMLEGITRKFLLRLCRELSIPVDLTPLWLADLPRASEAFLTSSTRGVVPVVDVAGVPIANGKPGRQTLRLSEAYRELVEREAGPAWPPP